MGREDDIKLIAYKIWEEESCPNGRDCEHWFKAEAIWEEQNKKTGLKTAKTEPKKPVSQRAKGKSVNKKPRQN